MRLGYRRQAQTEAQVDLTSMLDIVFILLIFFIVTSTFVRESGIEVVRPVSAHGQPQQELTMVIAIDAQDQIFFDGNATDNILLARKLRDTKTLNNETHLVIQADKSSSTGMLVKVMDIAKQEGISNIAIATAAGH